MQSPDLSYWQRQSDKVNKDAMRSVCKSQRIVVDAFPSMFSIPLLPRKADRRADEGGSETERYH
jgi:hypothetical protein